MEAFPYEEVYRLPELKGLRSCLSKVIFARLINEISESMRLEVVERTEEACFVKEHRKYYPVMWED